MVARCIAAHRSCAVRVARGWGVRTQGQTTLDVSYPPPRSAARRERRQLAVHPQRAPGQPAVVEALPLAEPDGLGGGEGRVEQLPLELARVAVEHDEAAADRHATKVAALSRRL